MTKQDIKKIILSGNSQEIKEGLKKYWEEEKEKFGEQKSLGLLKTAPNQPQIAC